MHVYSQHLLPGAAQMKSKWRPVKKGDEMMTTVIRTSFTVFRLCQGAQMVQTLEARQNQNKPSRVLYFYMMSRHNLNAIHHIYITTAIWQVL